MSDANAGCWWNAVQRHLGGYQQRYIVRPVGRLQQGTWQFLLNVGRKEQSPGSSANLTPCAQTPARCGGIQAAAASTIGAAATMAVRSLGQCRARGSRRHKKSPSFDGLFAFQVE